MLRRNKSLLKLINDQRTWSRKEVKRVKEFNGILTTRPLQQQSSSDYTDQVADETFRSLAFAKKKIPVIL